MFKNSSLIIAALLGAAVYSATGQTKGGSTVKSVVDSKKTKFISKPLVTSIYTADPSAHVFNGKIYIYPSHDIDAGIPENDNGDHFAMRDFHVLSMDRVGGKVTVNPVALTVKDIPWAGRQLWAPDAAYEKGTYYLYFPVKDKSDVFRIGVASSKSPTGPFKAEPQPIKSSFSIDPAVFKDTDGSYYMYFGGIWGGQLQRWATRRYEAEGSKTDLGKPDEPALTAKVVKLSKNMKEFSEAPRNVVILDAAGKPLLTKDHDHRFFEGSWMFKNNGKYYFTYSTGDTHMLCYATGTSPYGPFTYKGVILNPVQGWTTHHSIVQIKGKWYLFYHDTELSGKTWLRNVKVTPLTIHPDGTIETVDEFVK
ncbi:family 43 glycosylhydrolase [Mucilaginibacter robiniae]|uniref:Family 43 glycosylhydrolase n=1 Tax=Mucilaginibacter robiniae TaxID=2728022 RepID=A0A7L5E212_9SPHI|nr:glycoside hydrolase family 43 protein [Mucilaginibacter robiniae]QJD94386.1 family 43 glycosylhydrolase [Mucilaginibacter robiniae]